MEWSNLLVLIAATIVAGANVLLVKHSVKSTDKHRDEIRELIKARDDLTKEHRNEMRELIEQGQERTDDLMQAIAIATIVAKHTAGRPLGAEAALCEFKRWFDRRDEFFSRS